MFKYSEQMWAASGKLSLYLPFEDNPIKLFTTYCNVRECKNVDSFFKCIKKLILVPMKLYKTSQNL